MREFNSLTGTEVVEAIVKIRALERDRTKSHLTATDMARKIFPTEEVLDKAFAWEKYIDKVLDLESIVGELSEDMQISVVKELVKNINSKENRFYGSKKLETLHAAICEENWLETVEVNIRSWPRLQETDWPRHLPRHQQWDSQKKGNSPKGTAMAVNKMKKRRLSPAARSYTNRLRTENNLRQRLYAGGAG